MQRTIFITGATDGIGLETAKMLVTEGHHVLLHGRNPTKMQAVVNELSALPGAGRVEHYLADLSRMDRVETLADAVAEKHANLDVLINNAGIFKASETITDDGLDVRFAVNTFAPYLLTQRLMPLIGTSGRVINVSSAAQSPVDPEALAGKVRLDDMDAYAQSKLAITMWSRELSNENNSPTIIAVNPGSMLGSKMVKENFGVAGGELRIGAQILCRTALDDEFSSATGLYFDNDQGQFASPHADALDPEKSAEIVRTIEAVLASI